MSPGSFISSESAGSSNSLDDTDTVDNRMVTPIDDYVGPATIFEESSAESCLEQTSSGLAIVSRMPAPTESRLATSASPTNNDDTLISTSSAAPPIDINVNYTPIDIIPSSAGITAGTTSIMASSPPGNATHYSTILTGDTPISREPVNKPNDYMIMSPPVSSSNKKAVTSEAIKHKPLSGLIDEFAMDDTSASNVTSPNSQSSYNPLLDEIAGTESNTEDSSAYMVMSPATSSSGGGSRMGTGPRKISHHIKLSNEKNASEDYMDMSPAGKNSTGVPIPNRNERALSFGTSPSAALTSHLVDYMKTNSSNSTSATSDYLVMSPVDPDKNPDFASAGLQPVGKTPPIKLRTSSIESNSSGARPKTTKGRFYRGQSDRWVFTFQKKDQFTTMKISIFGAKIQTFL